MNKKEWIAQINDWQTRYGVVPKTVIEYDTTKITLACKKCGKIKHRSSRHHKCNDYLFACLLPDHYAKRYLEFRPEDVDRLCESCHRRWHEYCKPFLRRLYDQLSEMKGNKKEPSVGWCEDWKAAILKKYNNWMTIIPKNTLKQNDKTNSK